MGLGGKKPHFWHIRQQLCLNMAVFSFWIAVVQIRKFNQKDLINSTKLVKPVMETDTGKKDSWQRAKSVLVLKRMPLFLMRHPAERSHNHLYYLWYHQEVLLTKNALIYNMLYRVTTEYGFVPKNLQVKAPIRSIVLSVQKLLNENQRQWVTEQWISDQNQTNKYWTQILAALRKTIAYEKKNLLSLSGSKILTIPYISLLY